MRSDPKLEMPVGLAGLGGGNPPGREFADGVSQSGGERNHLFINAGGRDFSDLSGVSGLDDPADGRAFALLDFDRDGWLDIAAVNANAPLLQLFHNEIAPRASGGHIIALEFVGANHSPAAAAGKSNRDGVGTRVDIHFPDLHLVREIRAGEGLAAQNASMLLVGIGDRSVAPRIEVRWPSGTRQHLENVAAGTRLRVYEDPEQSPTGEAFVATIYRETSPEPWTPKPQATPRLEIADATAAAPLRLFTTMATWCEVCRRELEQVTLLSEALRAEGVALYGVPVDDADTREKLVQWRDRHRPAYELLIDLKTPSIEGVKEHVLDSLRRAVLPASIVVDREGRVLKTMAGLPSISGLRRLLDSATDQKSAR